MRANTIFFLVLLSLNTFAQTSHNLPIKDGNIHYKIFGAGADTILIINGGPGMNSEGFAGLATELGRDAVTIIYDQRGTGKSIIEPVNSETITMDLMVQDIEALRKHLGLSSWIVFGQSFGGMLGSYYTTKHPDRVNGLILSSSGGIDLELFYDLDILGKLTSTQRDQFNHWSRKIAEGDTTFNALLNRSKALAAAYLFNDQQEHIDAIGRRLTKANLEVNGIVHRNMEAIGFDCKPGLRKFKKPVLIIQGSNDIIPMHFGEKTHALLESSELIILERSAHYGWLEAREIYFEAIRSFLNKV